MSGTAGPPLVGPARPAPDGAGQDGLGGDERRSERRSARRRAERRKRSGHPGRTIIPALLAIIVVVAVAVLSSPLVRDSRRDHATDGGVTTSTSIAAAASSTAALAAGTPGSPKAGAAGSALLVVTQDGRVALIELFHGGPKGGIVLGLPSVTLLRYGDRFVQLAQVYSADAPRELARPVADALAVPLAAVASMEWGDLRTALGNTAGNVSLPAALDPEGADAGVLSVALAATVGQGTPRQPEPALWWEAAAFGGEANSFRTAVAAAEAAAGENAWTGQALKGDLVKYGAGLVYLEPDIQAARNMLAGTGAGS